MPRNSKQPRRSVRFHLHFLIVFFSILFQVAVPITAQSSRDGRDRKPNNGVDSPPVIVTAPTEFRPVNTTFTSSISVDDITGDGIVSFQFNINYDPAVINPVGPNFGCSTAGTIASGFLVTCNVITPGTLLLTANTGGVFIPTGSGPIVNLTFQAVPSAPGGSVSPLNFVPGSMFFFNNFGLFASTPVNGQVTLVAPTSAGVSVSGRVVTSDGFGIRNARIVVSGNSLSDPITVTTGAFGHYRINGLQAGETYVVTASSRRHHFSNGSQIVSLVDSVDDLIFVGELLGRDN